jgi:uncharacterized protein YqgV (UPF0045/DUF77 family)
VVDAEPGLDGRRSQRERGGFHTTIEMTLDTCSHVVAGMHREVADRIERVSSMRLGWPPG